MATRKQTSSGSASPVEGNKRDKIKMEIYGEEMLEKVVKASDKTGRLYLPPDWVGHRVMIIRLN